MDQNHATEYFSNGHRLLLAVNDACVTCSFGVQAEEIIVLCHENPSGGSSELKL